MTAKWPNISVFKSQKKIVDRLHLFQNKNLIVMTPNLDIFFLHATKINTLFCFALCSLIKTNKSFTHLKITIALKKN